jgi:hypothetical protein
MAKFVTKEGSGITAMPGANSKNTSKGKFDTS